MGCTASIPTASSPDLAKKSLLEQEQSTSQPNSPISENPRVSVLNTELASSAPFQDVGQKAASPSVDQLRKESTVASKNVQSAQNRSLEAPPLASLTLQTSAVSLAFLLKFIQRVEKDWSTRDVVSKLIVPETDDKKCCYLDLLPKEEVGAATYFLCHSWDAPFYETVSSILTHLDLEIGSQDCNAVYIWMDIFSVAQGLEHLDHTASISQVIAASKQTLFCLDARGSILQRIWCLYEIWLSVTGGESEAGFDKVLVLCNELDAPSLSAIFDSLDISRASATVEADRVKILAQIKGSADVSAVNLCIKRALVESGVLELQRAQSANTATLDLVRIMTKTVRMLRAYGNYLRAEEVMKQEDFDGLEEKLGDEQDCRLALAALLLERGQVLRKLGSAEDKIALQKCVDILVGVHGEAHPLVGETQVHLGVAHLSGGNVEAGLKLVEEGCKVLEATLGPKTSKLVDALNNLAEAYRMGGREQDQERVSLQALDLAASVYGPEHPHTALTYMHRGEQLRGQGRDKEAEEMLLKAAAVTSSALGPEHLQMGHINNRLASVFINKADWKQVEQAALGALSVYSVWYPPEHIFLAHARAKVGRARVAMQHWDAARLVLQPAMEVLKQHPDDPFTPFCRWCLEQLPAEEAKEAP